MVSTLKEVDVAEALTRMETLQTQLKPLPQRSPSSTR
jgi:hypothetical protein